jgi:hypothetical protein
MKWGDIKTRVRGNLTALIWKNKRGINMLRSLCHPPGGGTVCDGMEML